MNFILNLKDAFQNIILKIKVQNSQKQRLQIKFRKCFLIIDTKTEKVKDKFWKSKVKF